jgi:hypothetical protein
MRNPDPIIGTPLPGQPNPELEHVSNPQKLFMFLIAVGFITLVGLVAFLPDVAMPIK